jgi:hypothetical protein
VSIEKNYSQEFIRDVLRFWKTHTLIETSKKYNISRSLIMRWRAKELSNKEENTKVEVKKKSVKGMFTEEQKKEIAEYAIAYGQKKAGEKYNIPPSVANYFRFRMNKEEQGIKKSASSAKSPERKKEAKYEVQPLDQPEKTPKPQSKIMVICSEDPAQLLKMLKGLI